MPEPQENKNKKVQPLISMELVEIDGVWILKAYKNGEKIDDKVVRISKIERMYFA